MIDVSTLLDSVSYCYYVLLNVGPDPTPPEQSQKGRQDTHENAHAYIHVRFSTRSQNLYSVISIKHTEKYNMYIYMYIIVNTSYL
jgi:hypothetical protein